MTLVWRPGFAYDTDASNYIDAVEAADQADTPGIGAMETSVRYAINDFVIGCKNDGVWTAIKNSCILAGAKTLEGSFIDLKSCTKVITNNNFADGTYVGSNYTTGDYNRKTGLGDAANTTKYLNSNRNNNADPQDSQHTSVFVSTPGTPASATQLYMGASTSSGGFSLGMASSQQFSRNRSTTFTFVGSSAATGLAGTNRSAPGSYTHRVARVNTSVSVTSQAPADSVIHVFRENVIGGLYTNARLAFYSIGESLDLALLDNRVSTLIAQFGAVIP